MYCYHTNAAIKNYVWDCNKGGGHVLRNYKEREEKRKASCGKKPRLSSFLGEMVGCDYVIYNEKRYLQHTIFYLAANNNS